MSAPRSRNISISHLAHYASNPKSEIGQANSEAIAYGNRAHAAIGKAPSLLVFTALAATLIGVAYVLGAF